MYSFIKGVCRRWWLILLVALVTVAVGTLPRPVHYVADAKILFKVGREYLYQPETGNRSGPIASTSGVKNAVNGESQILNSRAVKLAALENYGIDRYLASLKSERVEGLLRLPFLHLLKTETDEGTAPGANEILDGALQTLTDALQVKTIDNTSVLHLTLKHSTPKDAEVILNEIVEVFLETRQKIYDDTNSNVMTEKLESVSMALEEAERDLIEFNTENDIYSLTDQQNMLIQQSVGMTEQMEQTKTSISELTTRLGLLEEQLANTPKTISIFKEQQANKLVEEAKGRLFELELEENKLLAAFREDSQTVSRVRGEISTVRAFLADQEEAMTEIVRTGRNDVYDKLMIDKIDVESELSAAQSRSRSMQESLGRINQQLLVIDSLRNNQRKFDRNIEALELRRRGYQEKVEDAQLIGDLAREQGTNARIIQDATASLKPVGLSLSQRLVLSTILGLLGGLILAAVVELISRGGAIGSQARLQTRIDDQVLDVPVLATIGTK